jgi:hypothetical protein
MEDIRVSATLWLQQLLIYYFCFLLPVGRGNVPRIITCTSQLDLSIENVTYMYDKLVTGKCDYFVHLEGLASQTL